MTRLSHAATIGHGQPLATSPAMRAVPMPADGWGAWCATTGPEDWHAVLPGCLPAKTEGDALDGLVAAIVADPRCDESTGFLAYLLSPPVRHVLSDPLLYDVEPSQADHYYRSLPNETPAKARPAWLDLAFFRLTRGAHASARFGIDHVIQVRLLKTRTPSHDAALTALGLPVPQLPLTHGAPRAQSRFTVIDHCLFEAD